MAKSFGIEQAEDIIAQKGGDPNFISRNDDVIGMVLKVTGVKNNLPEQVRKKKKRLDEEIDDLTRGIQANTETIQELEEANKLNKGERSSKKVEAGSLAGRYGNLSSQES